MLNQVFARGSIQFDRPGRRNVIGGDAVTQNRENAHTVQIDNRAGLRRHAHEVGGTVSYTHLDVYKRQVQSIGEGRVTFAGPKGGAGNLIQIEHSNGFQTFYMHLSRILVHNGEHISQGQIVGLVGMTGLATGPHLDFRIERRGQFLNFEHLPLPPADPVAPRDWSEFAAVRDRSLGLMPGAHESLASTNANEPAPVSRSANSPAPPAPQTSTP